mgnify:CR=1 FL=1
MTSRKLIGTLHLWLGLASGLVVFIVSLTGCLYVFETEIQSLYDQSYTTVRAQSGPRLPVSDLARIGQQALDSELKTTVKPEYANVTLYTAPTKAAYYYVYGQEGKLYHYVHLNPYTGQVLKVRDMNRDPFAIIVQLHTSLLLPHEIGHQVVGISVLVFVISLLTGLVLWWPRNKAALKQRFTVKWSARWRRINYDSHNVFGFYSLIPALLIALTGLVWSYEWVGKGVHFLFTGNTNAPTYVEPVSVKKTTRPANTVDRAFGQIANRYPQAASYYVGLPVADTSSIQVGVSPDLKTYYRDSYFYFDQYSGKLLKQERWETQNRGEKVRSMNYDIHVGRILGLPGQLLAFFASLVCASLPITGFLIWWGRRRKACKDIKNIGPMATTQPKRRPVYQIQRST